MRKLIAALILFSIFHSHFLHASDESPEFGQLESIELNDYEFYLPINFNSNGTLSLGIEGITPEHDDESEASGLQIKLSPILFFNSESVERNICSEKTTLTLLNLNVPRATHCSPMWNIRKSELLLGLGLYGHFGRGALGITPIKETKIFQKRAVVIGQKLESRTKFPSEVAAFSDWTVGDEINYERTLGLMIHADLETPIPLLEIGPGAEFTKTWEISIEKTSLNALEIKIETGEMKNVGAEISAMLAALEATSGNSKSVTFHFVINLEDPQANDAYQLLLAGSVEKAIQFSSISGAIQSIGIDREKAYVRTATIMAGVPNLFGARSARGIMKAVSVDDHGHKLSSTLVFRERVTEGRLSRHKIAGEYLAGSVDALPGDAFGHLGFVAFWAFEKEKLDDARLERKVKGFLSDLGLGKNVKISLPDDSDGYLRGETKVSFSSASLKALVNMIQSEMESEAFLQITTLSEDEKDAWTNTWSQIASRLRKARKSQDTLEYSRQLTLLARGLIEDASLLQAWIKKNAGVEVSVRVLGEKIPESTLTVPASDLI